MRRAHRTAHAFIWTLLPLALAAVIVFAWCSRPPAPEGALPAAAAALIGEAP